MKKILFIIFLLFLNYSICLSQFEDRGATCNPSVINWPNCTLVEVPARAYINNIIYVPSGHYSMPYIADKPNTEYILQGDITADRTAITIKASYVVINLNGFKIIYNQTAPGEGVNMGSYNLRYVAIVNGSIIQGAAVSEGDVYGRGNNPVGTYNSADGVNYSASYFHTANLYLKYGGKDVTGIYTYYSSYSIHEQNTIEDNYYPGTLKDRHQGIDAINCGGASDVTIRNNTIINARHRGINVKENSRVYGNYITIRSIATNSYGILGYRAKNIFVYDNVIIGRGEHPIGIGFVSGSNNIEIYNNYIDTKITSLGIEYGGSNYCFDPNDSRYPCGNYAVGFRTTWGGNNIKFYNNEIYITTDSYYLGTYSPTGAPVHVNAKGRGLMVAINAGETATFSNNKITVLDKNGTGDAFGIVCTGNNESDALFFINNIVKSNIANIVLSDEYGYCKGYPLFLNNVLIKENSFPRYTAISNQLGGYFDTTGRIIDNNYSGGIDINLINFNPSGNGLVSVYFGSIENNRVVYNYRYHDNNGTSNNLLREDYNPPIILNYALPPIENVPPDPPKNLRVF